MQVFLFTDVLLLGLDHADRFCVELAENQMAALQEHGFEQHPPRRHDCRNQIVGRALAIFDDVPNSWNTPYAPETIGDVTVRLVKNGGHVDFGDGKGLRELLVPLFTSIKVKRRASFERSLEILTEVYGAVERVTPQQPGV
jgi:hypothetical protein